MLIHTELGSAIEQKGHADGRCGSDLDVIWLMMTVVGEAAQHPWLDELFQNRTAMQPRKDLYNLVAAIYRLGPGCMSAEGEGTCHTDRKALYRRRRF